MWQIQPSKSILIGLISDTYLLLNCLISVRNLAVELKSIKNECGCILNLGCNNFLNVLTNFKKIELVQVPFLFVKEMFVNKMTKNNIKPIP